MENLESRLKKDSKKVAEALHENEALFILSLIGTEGEVGVSVIQTLGLSSEKAMASLVAIVDQSLAHMIRLTKNPEPIVDLRQTLDAFFSTYFGKMIIKEKGGFNVNPN